MRITLQPGFVLHSKQFNETSCIVDAFTSQGRVSLLAKAVRTPRSRFRGLLRPFVPLLLSWSGKTELMSLSAAEPSGSFLELQGNALLSGIYINELLVRFLPKSDPHPTLFKNYHAILVSLATAQDQEHKLRLFERDLLVELGYGLSLNKDILTGEPVHEEFEYVFIPRHGISRRLPQHIKSYTFRGKNLLAFHHGKLYEAEDLHAAKRLMRLAIAAVSSGRPLRSREFFKAR